ncbi:phosphotransferase enzyme family protein [Streptosporangium sp. V21-05]|uniref:phosphotransferase enzyme family protein n=1 Tax=Streptosporangium sp. V21-05 TaxID=3446115 RepID=UPI003F529850
MSAVLSKSSTLLQLCRAAGIDGRDARLIRVCVNVVFHLPRANAVARIASAETTPRARGVVRLAHWLEAIGFPAVRIHRDVPDAILMDGQVATFWEHLPQKVGSPPVVRLAPLLRRLHAQTPPSPLPSWDPVTEARSNLQLARGVVHDRDRGLLLDWCGRLEAELPTLRHSLPHGLIHGDAWAGNLLWRGEGVVLCDLDQMCYGPRAWDLVPTAVNALRFGHPPADELLAAYGFDVTASAVFPLLRQIRELTMLTGVLPALPDRPSIAEEFRRRVASLRVNGPDRWTPYG